MKGWLLLAALPLCAQELYIVPAGFAVMPGERVVVAFHNAGRTEAVRDATLQAGAAAYNITSLRPEGDTVLGNAAVRAEGTLIVHAGAAGRASAKALLVSRRAGPAFNRRIGLPLEIVPERDPYTLKAGDALPVLVLLRGKPAACAVRVRRLEAGGPAAELPAGPSGRVLVSLLAPGKWLLAAGPCEGFSTSLTFELF